jgi:hypothetical protein
MAKVSVGLRGWRFDEDAVFDDDGGFRPLAAMDPDDRDRLARLVVLVGRPCDACALDGADDPAEATVVYGEPGAEVLLCDAHEPAFVYWFREAGGSDLRGDPALREAFHAWFDDGGRAPAGYAGVEHVESAPDALPDPPDPGAVRDQLEAGVELDRVDMRALAGDDEDGEPLTAADLARSDLDLDAEYPDG